MKSLRWLVGHQDEKIREYLLQSIEDLHGHPEGVCDLAKIQYRINESHYDILVLDIHLLLHQERWYDLLAFLKTRFPHTVVIILYPEINEPEALTFKKAGAHYIIPLISDPYSLARIILSLAQQTLLKLRLKVKPRLMNRHKALLFSDRVYEGFRYILNNKFENVAIIGAEGTGKTALSHEIYDSFCEKYHYGRGEKRGFINCAMYNQDQLSQVIFGSQKKGWYEPSCFQVHTGGVVIFDNAHEISPKLQTKLLACFEQGEIITYNTQKVQLDHVKVVFSFKQEALQGLCSGFVEKVSQHIINLPPVSEFFSVKDQLFNLLQERHAEMTFTPEFVASFCRFFQKKPLRSGFHSLKRVLQLAVENAYYHNRSYVIKSDFPSDSELFPYTFKESLEVKSITGHHGGRELLEKLSQGKDYLEAKELLQEVIIAVAADVCEGNVSKMAHHLGVQRQSLYRMKGFQRL